MPVDGERRNIKPKSSYWVAARPGQKVVASDSVREFYSSSAYRGPQGRVKLAPSFGRFGGPTRYLHSLRKEPEWRELVFMPLMSGSCSREPTIRPPGSGHPHRNRAWAWWHMRCAGRRNSLRAEISADDHTRSGEWPRARCPPTLFRDTTRLPRQL